MGRKMMTSQRAEAHVTVVARQGRVGASPIRRVGVNMECLVPQHEDGPINERGLTQTRAARLFGVTQPRVSDLVRGRIELFSIDALVEMLGRAGIGLAIRLESRRRPA